MAIKPQILLGNTSKKQYIAKKEFTDRDDYRIKFFDKIEEISSEKESDIIRYNVLNFYGIGGIGKSSLQRELCREIESNNDIIYVQADFANSFNRNASNLLLELAKSFETQKILFYHFGLAYAIYFEKTHKDMISLSNKHNIINENLGFIADILGIIDGLGILGIVPGAINKIYNASYNKLHLDGDIKEDLREMEYKNASQCEQLLPAFFAYDLNKYLKKENSKTIVIFLDTYEALWGQIKNDITKFSQDQFVRELISHLPGVLFVISGREYLDWKALDPDWNNYLEQYQMERLGDVDVNEFLVKCGIEEDDIRNKMLSISMGHPYHLDILVDTYVEMKNNNISPQVDLFANNAREILQCFFKYLQTEEIAVIKIISIPRYYTFDIFNHLLSTFPTGYPITLFDEFNKFSFVSKMDNGTYHIHEIMRKDLLEIIPKELYKKVNKIISEYYFTLFNRSTVYNEKKRIIRECVYHLKFYLKQQEYVKFLLSNFHSYFIDLQYRGESAYLYDIFTDIFSYISYSDCIELYEIYTDMIMLIGNFKEAVENIDFFLKQYTIEQIAAKEDILQLYVKKLKHQMVYSSLNETISAINSIKLFVHNTSFHHQYLELLYTEGNMLFEKGDFQACQICFDNVMKLSEQYGFMDMKCRVLRKKADYYLLNNDVFKADELCHTGLEIANKNDLNRYGNYLECTQAEIYRKLKLFEQSKELYKNSQEKFSELGIQPWIAHTELGLAMIDLEQENYSAVNQHLDLAEKIYTQHCHTWGIIHTKFARLQSDFMQKGLISQPIYNELNNICKKYRYDYILDLLEKLKYGECVTTNLMFL